MRIALCGSSSTGKTTLAIRLMENGEFRNLIPQFITTDARKLLKQGGFTSMDLMTQDQLRDFQLEYFQRKMNLENEQSAFLTDRSFVDVAAYWTERDMEGAEEDEINVLIAPCRERARTYDIHFFLPFGVIPFSADGYRSSDLNLHKRIDRRIRALLIEWKLPFAVMDFSGIDDRAEMVFEWLRKAQ